jgi:hypothetical protein
VWVLPLLQALPWYDVAAVVAAAAAATLGMIMCIRTFGHSITTGFCADAGLCSFFEEAGQVIKSLHPWSRFCNLYDTSYQQLANLYALTKQLPNLVHSSRGPEVDEDTYTVELEPIGLTPTSAVPTTEQQVAYAVLGGLRGLHSLHSVSHQCALLVVV